MSQNIFYKFKSARDYDKIDLGDARSISLRDLKQQIMLQKNLSRSHEFDLQIQNAQTGHDYRDDRAQIVANTSVIIKRVPVIRGGMSKPATTVPGLSSSSKTSSSTTTSSGIPGLAPSASIPGLGSTNNTDSSTTTKDSEQPVEDQTQQNITALLSSTNPEYAPTRSQSSHANVSGRQSDRAPPANYICHRCGRPGHFIQFCPTNGDPNYERPKKLARPLGIPLGFLKTVDVSSSQDLPKGAMFLGGGKIAVMRANERSFTSKQTNLAPSEIPESLRCPLCHGLFRNAVLSRCCGSSFCSDCITRHLAEQNKPTCPKCHRPTTADDLIVNQNLRDLVNRFRVGHESLIDPSQQQQQDTSEINQSIERRDGPQDKVKRLSPPKSMLKETSQYHRGEHFKREGGRRRRDKRGGRGKRYERQHEFRPY